MLKLNKIQMLTKKMETSDAKKFQRISFSSSRRFDLSGSDIIGRSIGNSASLKPLKVDKSAFSGEKGEDISEVKSKPQEEPKTEDN